MPDGTPALDSWAPLCCTARPHWPGFGCFASCLDFPLPLQALAARDAALERKESVAASLQEQLASAAAEAEQLRAQAAASEARCQELEAAGGSAVDTQASLAALQVPALWACIALPATAAVAPGLKAGKHALSPLPPYLLLTHPQPCLLSLPACLLFPPALPGLACRWSWTWLRSRCSSRSRSWRMQR